MGFDKYFLKHWKEVHEVTLELIKQIPPDKMSFNMGGENMSLSEYIVHIYRLVKIASDKGLTGKAILEDYYSYPYPEPETVEDLYEYASSVFDEMYERYSGLSSAEMEKPVSIPWYSEPVPLWQYLFDAFEQMWHYRGEFYLTLNLAGVGDRVFVLDHYENKYPD